jgi:predicted ATPase
VVRLELPRFSRAELAEQLAGLLGADPSARLVDQVHARSEGNPFFAEELLLAGTDPGVLPPSLQEVLIARVVRLGRGTQQLLRVAAAAGPGATQPLLAAVTGLGEQQLFAGLREAVDQQLLVPEPSGGLLLRAFQSSTRPPSGVVPTTSTRPVPGAGATDGSWEP